jgi:hypothetical protein
MKIKAIQQALLTIAFLGLSSQAAELVVHSRGLVSACGYYSNTQVEWKLRYTNTDIPWGSKLYLVSGVHGQDNGEAVRWSKRVEQELHAIDAYTWEATSHRVVHQRGNLYNYSDVAFVIRVELPNGQQYYDNGAAGPMSYYEFAINRNEFTCVTDSLPSMPSFELQELQIRNP